MENENKKCCGNLNTCPNIIDLSKDKTWCGYGRCPECCAKVCGHRTHINEKATSPEVA